MKRKYFLPLLLMFVLSIGGIDTDSKAAAMDDVGAVEQITLNEDNCTCSEDLGSGGINITVTVDSPCDIIVPEQIADMKIETFRNITILGEGAKKVYLPNSIKEFTESGYSIITGQCETVVLPEGITKIVNNMFSYSEIQYLELPDSVQEIGDWAFNGSEIQNITLPGNCRSIGRYAFSYCENITAILLPGNCQSIGESAFSGCRNMKSITIPAGVETLGNSVFEGCSSLKEINVDIGNKAFASKDGVLFDAALTTIAAYPPAKPETEYIVPAGVTTIAESAFRYNEYIEKIDFPDSLLSIGGYAFADCTKLTEIEIPESVNYVGWNAFGWTKYSEDYVQKTETPLVYVGKWLVGCDYNYQYGVAFDAIIKEGTERIAVNALSNRKWGTIQFPKGMSKIDESIAVGQKGDNSRGIRTVIIPDGVTEIGKSAFIFNPITYVNIPASVTKIGKDALNNSSVEHIFCEKDSYAEQYAKENGIPYSYVADTVVKETETGELELVYSPDSETTFGADISVTGLFVEGTSVEVTELDKDSEASKAFAQTIAEMEGMTVKEQMDISTNQMQTSGDLHIKIPVDREYDGKEGYILHYKNGAVESYPIIVTDGKAETDVEGLSPFALVLESVIVKGDINADGKISMTDLLMCLHHVSGRTSLAGDAFLAADINGDGDVKMADLMRILHYVSGRNEEL